MHMFLQNGTQTQSAVHTPQRCPHHILNIQRDRYTYFQTENFPLGEKEKYVNTDVIQWIHSFMCPWSFLYFQM